MPRNNAAKAPLETMSTPVHTRRSKSKRVVDSNDHQPGPEFTRRVKSTGPAADAIDKPVIQQVDGPLNKKKMDELVFMQDMCEVVISTSDDPNADPLPTIIVDNGAKRYIAAFVRGVPKFVPRYIVERLARMKKTDFGNRQVKDEETGELSYEHPETNTWVYPFLVKTDPAGPKGRDWLTKVMAER